MTRKKVSENQLARAKPHRSGSKPGRQGVTKEETGEGDYVGKTSESGDSRRT